MDNILVIINEIGDNDLINYLNLFILLGEIVNFVKNILNIYSSNNNITININSLMVRMWVIKIKLNQKFTSSPTLSFAVIVVPGKEN